MQAYVSLFKPCCVQFKHVGEKILQENAGMLFRKFPFSETKSSETSSEIVEQMLQQAIATSNNTVKVRSSI